MRATSPCRALPLALAGLLAASCANRGMHAPEGAGGTGLAGGGRGGGGGSTGGSGGAAGNGCPAPVARDGGMSCTSKFSFEAGSQGAAIATTGQAAFTDVEANGTQTFCGSGALAVTASFSGTSGSTTKG